MLETESIIKFNSKLKRVKMKCIAILSALTFLCVFHYAGANSALIKTLAGTCKKTENASDNDVENIAKGKAPETPEGKCLAGEFV